MPALTSREAAGLYRWEDAFTLMHSCWACGISSNNVKALHSCYGIHTTPCTAYHKTMHAIATSHQCCACIQNAEVREQRHREIARLLIEYNDTISPGDGQSVGRKIVAQRPASIDSDDRLSTIRNDENAKHKCTKADIRSAKRAKKATESITKATKSQARHNLVDITADDVDHISSTLYGNTAVHGHPVADDAIPEDLFERIAGFTNSFEGHKSALARESTNQRRNTNHKTNTSPDADLDAAVDGALLRLGIDVNHLNSPVLQHATLTTTKKTPVKKGPDAIINRLRFAIRDDMQKHENELRQVLIRAEGFYRYAGRTVFERLRGIAEEAEWRGKKYGNERPDEDGREEEDARQR